MDWVIYIFQMLKWWDLDDNFDFVDKMKNMIELRNIFIWDPYYLRVYRDIYPQITSYYEM